MSFCCGNDSYVCIIYDFKSILSLELLRYTKLCVTIAVVK